MKLIRYNKANCASDLDHFFDWSPLAFGKHGLLDRYFENETSSGKPSSSVREDENNYFVHVEIPGVKKDEVNLEVKDNVLSLSTEVKEEKEGSYQRSSYNQSYRLPKDINAEKINAELENGILTITLPKAEEVKPKSIKVK